MTQLHVYITNDDARDIRESLHRLLITTSSAVALFDKRKEREKAYNILSQWKWFRLPNQAIAASGPIEKPEEVEEWFNHYAERNIIAITEDAENGYEVFCHTEESAFHTASMQMHDLILQQFPPIFARYWKDRETIVVDPAGYTVQSDFLVASRGDYLQQLSADVCAVLGHNIVRATSNREVSCVYYIDAYGYETILTNEEVFNIQYNKTAELFFFPEIRTVIPYFVVNAERHVMAARFREIYLPIFDNTLYSMFNDFIALV